MSRNERGFTLIEVMIALAIFAVMVGAIAMANTQNLTAASQIQDQSEGRWVNQQALAELRMSALPDAGSSITKDIAFNGRDWEVEITVTPFDMEPIGHLIRSVELRAIPAGSDVSADVLKAYLGATE